VAPEPYSFHSLQVALHFVQDKNTRFDLAIECGNLDVALETADSIDRPELWNRLAQQALQQGNHKVRSIRWLGGMFADILLRQVVEKAYQRTKNFDRLSFLYLVTGTLDKLAKMQKIADMRGDQMSKFHNALYAGDVRARINVLRDVGLRK
jgi:coatomer protein complex subunit alpha (xenin)